jgi:hypothetical protein
VVIAAAIAVALAVALWVTTNRRPVSAEASAAPTRA